jgi:hypothetical protein
MQPPACSITENIQPSQLSQSARTTTRPRSQTHPDSARAQRKGTLVSLGQQALSRGDMDLVRAITTIIAREGGGR